MILMDILMDILMGDYCKEILSDTLYLELLFLF